jgi:hypothetical protein
MEFIEQCCLKRIPKEFIIERFYMPPQERIANATLRNKTMDMRVPLRFLPKVCRMLMKPGVKSSDLLIL